MLISFNYLKLRKKNYEEKQIGLFYTWNYKEEKKKNIHLIYLQVK